MGLTREQAIAEHRKMWNWIADEHEKGNYLVDKSDYLESHGFSSSEMINDCFLCTYAKKNCKNCPLVWNNEKCIYVGSEYKQYCDAPPCQEDYILARKIANLPEREDQ